MVKLATGIMVYIVVAVLLVMIASRLGEDAVSITVGVVAGITAGISTSFLLLAAMHNQEQRRNHAARTRYRPTPRQLEYPTPVWHRQQTTREEG